jgi:hypothetical protein
MRANTTFPSNASFLGKRFQTGESNGNCIGPPVTLFGCPPILPGAENQGRARFTFRILLIRLYAQIDCFSIDW